LEEAPVRVRFFLLNADAGSGIVRSTFQTAASLAADHDVDIVSVVRRLDQPLLPLDPRVRLRSLVDARGSAAVEHRAAAKLLARGRSRLAQAGDERSVRHLTLLADARLARAIREVREGVVVGTRASISLAVARFARPSVYAVAQEHQNLAFWADDLRRSFATIYPRLDAMVTLTPGDAAAYTSMLPPEVLVRDIPNALPDRDLPSACSGAPVVVAAGRLTRQKGFDLLVAAFARVHRKHPDWQLHIFGKGADREVVEAAIRDRGLADVVVLRGFSATLLEEMAATGSIFALSSRYEGYPIVLIEAMSLGLAPVAFDCPTGPADIIEDGTSGLLVRPRKVAAMARAINDLIEDPDRRARLAAAAREQARQFSAAVVAPRWTSLLADLASRQPGQRRSSIAWPSPRK
jgi:glycosyltransferase involved in cell wall biosynthesis